MFVFVVIGDVCATASSSTMPVSFAGLLHYVINVVLVALLSGTGLGEFPISSSSGFLLFALLA
jgi:hypothetical protein